MSTVRPSGPLAAGTIGSTMLNTVGGAPYSNRATVDPDIQSADIYVTCLYSFSKSRNRSLGAFARGISCLISHEIFYSSFGPYRLPPSGAGGRSK